LKKTYIEAVGCCNRTWLSASANHLVSWKTLNGPHVDTLSETLSYIRR